MSQRRSVSDEALLEMLKAGKRDKEIAYELHLHPGTISRLIAGAMDRCGAKTRSHAVAMYMERDSIPAVSPPAAPA